MKSFLLQFEEQCQESEGSLGTETFTKANGSDDDQDNHFSPFAGTQTFTEAREEPDQDINSMRMFIPVLGTSTGTRTREEPDQDLDSPVMRIFE